MARQAALQLSGIGHQWQCLQSAGRHDVGRQDDIVRRHQRRLFHIRSIACACPFGPASQHHLHDAHPAVGTPPLYGVQPDGHRAVHLGLHLHGRYAAVCGALCHHAQHLCLRGTAQPQQRATQHPRAGSRSHTVVQSPCPLRHRFPALLCRRVVHSCGGCMVQIQPPVIPDANASSRKNHWPHHHFHSRPDGHGTACHPLFRAFLLLFSTYQPRGHPPGHGHPLCRCLLPAFLLPSCCAASIVSPPASFDQCPQCQCKFHCLSTRGEH